MKIESRIIKNGSRSVSIREAEGIYEDTRDDAINEYLSSDLFAGSHLGCDDRDYLSLRGGVLG